MWYAVKAVFGSVTGWLIVIAGGNSLLNLLGVDYNFLPRPFDEVVRYYSVLLYGTINGLLDPIGVRPPDVVKDLAALYILIGLTHRRVEALIRSAKHPFWVHVHGVAPDPDEFKVISVFEKVVRQIRFIWWDARRILLWWMPYEMYYRIILGLGNLKRGRKASIEGRVRKHLKQERWSEEEKYRVARLWVNMELDYAFTYIVTFAAIAFYAVFVLSF